MKPLALLLALLCSSCAYVQTHKNVEEQFRTYRGYEIESREEAPVNLYRIGNRYYIQVEEQTFRKHHPIVHDEIMFTGNNEPMMESLQPIGRRYIPISNDTAGVLLRPDGYVTMPVLRDELLRHAEQAISLSDNRLPNAPCKIRADLTEQNAPNARAVIPEGENPPIPPAGNILGGVDRVVIDAPLTLLYNCAIPVMAPFNFFYHFYTDEK